MARHRNGAGRAATWLLVLALCAWAPHAAAQPKPNGEAGAAADEDGPGGAKEKPSGPDLSGGAFEFAGFKYTLGGFVKVDLSHDLGPRTPGPRSGDLISFSSIPLDSENPAAGGSRIHARASRIFLATEAETSIGPVRTHIELDFFGQIDGNRGNDDLLTSSHEVRLRHAILEFGGLMVGQYWSNFMDLNSNGDSITFDGVVGKAFSRQAQVRYTYTISQGNTLAIAVENPETDLTRTSVTDTIYRVNVEDPAPDVTAAARLGGGWGGFALRGVGRYLKTRDEALDREDTAIGWGTGVSGWISLGGPSKVHANFIYGDGIGRYLNNNQLFAAAVDVTDESLQTITAWGALVGGTYWLGSIAGVTALYGMQRTNADELLSAAGAPLLQPAAIYTELRAIHGNVRFNLARRLSTAIGYTWGERTAGNGEKGRVSRILMDFKRVF